MSNAIANGIIHEFNRRVHEENVGKIESMLSKLTKDEIWHKENNHSNSVGNLVLHLCGNVRQWICSGIGKEKDIRQRDKEFQIGYNLDAGELVARLRQLKSETDAALDGLSDEQLLDKRKVQGYDETVVSIIIHVTEHFSYHTGQIAMVTKWLKDEDLEFYKGVDLNAVGN